MHRSHSTKRSFFRRVMATAFVFGAATMPALAEPLELLITPRAPYYVIDDNGAVSGIVADRAVQAFAEAGIEVRWTVVSFNRQLRMVEDNNSALCGVGWFKNPVRETFAKFTDYIYQDKPLIALSRADNREVRTHPNLRDLMADKSLTMGTKLGFSYGTMVDDYIETLKPTTISTDQNNVGMTRMLIGGRFDYMISAPEEAAHLIASLGAEGEDLTMVILKDLPPQNRRYIMCSRQVGDDIIETLNAAIRALR